MNATLTDPDDWTSTYAHPDCTDCHGSDVVLVPADDWDELAREDPCSCAIIAAAVAEGAGDD